MHDRDDDNEVHSKLAIDNDNNDVDDDKTYIHAQQAIGLSLQAHSKRFVWKISRLSGMALASGRKDAHATGCFLCMCALRYIGQQRQLSISCIESISVYLVELERHKGNT